MGGWSPCHPLPDCKLKRGFTVRVADNTKTSIDKILTAIRISVRVMALAVRITIDLSGEREPEEGDIYSI